VRFIIQAVFSLVALLAPAMIGMVLPENIVVSVIVLLSFAATAWLALLAADERTAIQGLKARLLLSRLRPKPIGT
jgi:hypothetical protein